MLKSSYGTTLLKAAADFELVRRKLVQKPRTWLVTGCAGFIGSHILECLLLLKQRVVGLDNFSTGSRQNLILVRRSVGPKAWKRFQMIRGDVTRVRDCYKALNEGTNWPEHRKKGNRKSTLSFTKPDWVACPDRWGILYLLMPPMRLECSTFFVLPRILGCAVLSMQPQVRPMAIVRFCLKKKRLSASFCHRMRYLNMLLNYTPRFSEYIL